MRCATVKEIKEEEESTEPIERVGSCAPERGCLYCD